MSKANNFIKNHFYKLAQGDYRGEGVWDGVTFHLSHVVDMFKAEIKLCSSLGLVIWIVPNCEVWMLQCFPDIYSLSRIKCQKLFKKIQCYKSTQILKKWKVVTLRICLGKDMVEWDFLHIWEIA